MEGTCTATPMPKYRSHKEVWALQLVDVLPDDGSGFGELFPVQARFAPIKIEAAWLAKHNPQEQPDGSYGYYVQYEDGYTSWSPSQAFEDGYTLIGA